MNEGIPALYNQVVKSISAPKNDFDQDYWSDIIKQTEPILRKLLKVASNSKSKLFQPITYSTDLTDLAIKISYQSKTKVAHCLPSTMDELYTIIQTTFWDMFVDMPDFRDFEMYFIDSDEEKCMLETSEDLRAAYMHVKNYSQFNSILKIFIEYRHGMTNKQKCQRWAEWFRNDGNVSRKRQFKERNKLRQYSFMKGNCIVRDGYVYEKYKSWRGYNDIQMRGLFEVRV